MLFATVLVANRGEIACRVIRTLHDLGIRSVAVYTDTDAGALHISLADVAVRVEDYLDVAALVAAATSTGAQAVHPGYGFLSENVDFARACQAAGVIFIGPGVEAMEAMGDKIRAKEHVSARGVPVIPGAGDAGMSDAHLIHAAVEVGYPLLIKPSGGGGGKGMTVVTAAEDLPESIASARRVAARAFGDDTLLLERLITTPRHIEVQVLADSHGKVIHLGERECSLQRRHQKVVEEAPSPLLTVEVRAAIGEAACEVARSVDYVGAGTVEFLVSDAAPGEFFFMEMNTRLQVEHPVTELITGLDLVAWQLRVAAGEPLTIAQSDVRLDGHAVEVRLYAEDPGSGFLPTSGTVRGLREPHGEGVRVDSALVEGLTVASAYDPMLAKIIAWGADRDEALARLDRALLDTTVLGLRTNLSFLRTLLADDDVRAGRLDTGLVERILTGFESPPPDAAALATAALLEHSARWYTAAGPWARPTGWRVGAPRAARYHLGDSAQVTTVEVLGPPEAALVDGRPTRFRHDERTATIELDGSTEVYRWIRAGDVLWLSSGVATWDIPVHRREQRLAAHRRTLTLTAGAVSPEVRAVMPGTVVSVFVDSGAEVEAGQPLLALEAMKMEHAMLAPIAGIVTITVRSGDQVRLDQVVALIEPTEGAA